MYTPLIKESEQLSPSIQLYGKSIPDTAASPVSAESKRRAKICDVDLKLRITGIAVTETDVFVAFGSGWSLLSICACLFGTPVKTHCVRAPQGADRRSAVDGQGSRTAVIRRLK